MTQDGRSIPEDIAFSLDREDLVAHCSHSKQFKNYLDNGGMADFITAFKLKAKWARSTSLKAKLNA